MLEQLLGGEPVLLQVGHLVVLGKLLGPEGKLVLCFCQPPIRIFLDDASLELSFNAVDPDLWCLVVADPVHPRPGDRDGLPASSRWWPLSVLARLLTLVAGGVLVHRLPVLCLQLSHKSAFHCG